MAIKNCHHKLSTKMAYVAGLDWWQFCFIFYPHFWPSFLTIWKTVLETWHLRHWLQFWQLRTWIQTIIFTWQLIVTLDSIRNSCDVLPTCCLDNYQSFFAPSQQPFPCMADSLHGSGHCAATSLRQLFLDEVNQDSRVQHPPKCRCLGENAFQHRWQFTIL